jgi:hypothetical protein
MKLEVRFKGRARLLWFALGVSWFCVMWYSSSRSGVLLQGMYKRREREKCRTDATENSLFPLEADEFGKHRIL